ncbi:MAG: hypothetical protein IT376_01330 [Polyangiaceae bacterium]|nr:hypothetical protein [Polyangiaceae bacterium]
MTSVRRVARLLALGRRRLRRGDAAGAIDRVRRALTLAPNDAAGHALLSIALSHADRRRAAAVEAERALVAAPGSPLANLACALVAPGGGRARSHLHEALAAAADDALVVEQAAALYLRLGDLAAAASCAAHALQLAPESAPAQVVLGGVARARGDRAAAIEHAETALDNEPRDRGALLLSGWLHLDDGEATHARDLAAWVLAAAPGSRDALRLLAAVKSRRWAPSGWAFRASVFFGHGDRAGGAKLLLGAGLVLPLTLELTGVSESPSVVWPAAIAMWGLCRYAWSAPRGLQRELDRHLHAARARAEP